MKNLYEKNMGNLLEATKNVQKAFDNLEAALSKVKQIKDKRSRFEKIIDKISYFLFGGKSMMPNELKPFR